jgi:hypothetical protein|tara:strand:- start:688 stop:954 length:267 start_codon:yes stop_codon:yes gene_type:complete
MKLYRVQVKYKNIYIDETLEAQNDKAVLEDFAKKVDSQDVIEKPGAGFEDPNILFLTFEEVDRNATTKVNIGKTSIGVQVGQSGVNSG